jgi:hypothetical protein
MFMPVFESLKKVAGTTVQMQQEMFNKWFSLWPGIPVPPGTPPAWTEPMQRFQKRWAEAVGELLRQYKETIDTQFKAGQQNIEKAFQIGEARSAEELRAKTIELFQKCFEAVAQVPQAQLRGFQGAVEKWFELVSAPVPTP